MPPCLSGEAQAKSPSWKIMPSHPITSPITISRAALLKMARHKRQPDTSSPLQLVSPPPQPHRTLFPNPHTSVHAEPETALSSPMLPLNLGSPFGTPAGPPTPDSLRLWDSLRSSTLPLRTRGWGLRAACKPPQARCTLVCDRVNTLYFPSFPPGRRVECEQAVCKMVVGSVGGTWGSPVGAHPGPQASVTLRSGRPGWGN